MTGVMMGDRKGADARVGTKAGARELAAAQVALLRHIEATVRRLAGLYGYRGPLEVQDLCGMVAERIVRRAHYLTTFRTQPSALHGLVWSMVRSTFFDAFRAESCQQRRAPFGQAPAHEERLEDPRASDPDRAVMVRAVGVALRGFCHHRRPLSCPGTPRRVRVQMVDAFQLHVLGGMSHREVEARLGVPRATAGHWIRVVKLHVRQSLEGDAREALTTHNEAAGAGEGGFQCRKPRACAAR